MTEPSTADNSDESSTALAIRAPDRSPNERPIDLRVTGAPPGSSVEVTASLVDADGVEWYSTMTFAADATGTVDLSEQAPDSGAYDGVAPMGWLWSMRSDADVPFATLTAPEVTVDLAANAAGKRAERSITRVLYDDGLTVHRVEREGLVGTLYVPSSDGPHPGVLSLHGSGGPSSGRFPRLLASHGFATFAVEYFGDAEPLPDRLARIPLSYVDVAADWLRDRDAVGGDRLGVVGSSRGGELALLLGARYNWAGAVVTYAGSGVAYDTPDGTPAWVVDGEPVPHISGRGEPERVDGRVLTRPVLERGLDAASEADRRAATIAVEETDGPVLLLSGTADGVWPAGRLSEIAVERLERENFEHPFEHRSYEGCGHLIGVPYAPLSGVAGGDVRARATAQAGADSWPAVLETLAAGLDTSRDDGD
jgi:dienelactone hydrolase